MSKKLTNTSKKFYVASLARILIKEQEGFEGCDDYGNKGLFKGKIRTLARKRKLTQKILMDIGNYCNFLWNLMEEKKNEKNTVT